MYIEKIYNLAIIPFSDGELPNSFVGGGGGKKTTAKILCIKSQTFGELLILDLKNLKNLLFMS